ncbi:CBS domain-containing protein [Nakamurella lactea]|uniref:CBS domain-containing protein n=1 Tax=Nakamurella lactea TaxID=459515 RepID=UPI00041FF265|nr:CBS domain-containing protein [Nakamurella lactea]
MRVKSVLDNKGSTVATIAPTATVAELVAALAEHKIGALVVTTDGTDVAGIVSERDVARALHAHGAALLEQRVADIMTTPVRTCGPTDEIRELAKVMTDGRFRHLPVVANGALAGIVTIGDIVKSRIDELETEQHQLVDYISSTR